MNPRAPVKVFAFGPGFGIPFETSGPFPLKLLTWLRMAEIPYEFEVANDPRKGPKGKSPWIEFEGRRMGDSTFIIEFLAARHGVALDPHLSPGERARGLAIQRMVEEHLHQCYEHQLFLGHGGRERLAEFAATAPPPIRWLLPKLLTSSLKTQLHARGMGRHSEDLILAQGEADLDALAELLGENLFFLGDRPSLVDATVFGFLGVMVYVDGDNPLYRFAADQEILMAYCERMRARFFPETLSADRKLRSTHEDLEPPLRERDGSRRAVVA